MTVIKTLDDLRLAAQERKSVYRYNGGVFSRPTPAAVVYNMQACWVHQWLERGLYIYEPKPKRSWFKDQEAWRMRLHQSLNKAASKFTALELAENSSKMAATLPLPASPPPRKSRSSKKQTHG